MIIVEQTDRRIQVKINLLNRGNKTILRRHSDPAQMAHFKAQINSKGRNHIKQTQNFRCEWKAFSHLAVGDCPLTCAEEIRLQMPEAHHSLLWFALVD